MKKNLLLKKSSFLFDLFALLSLISITFFVFFKFGRTIVELKDMFTLLLSALTVLLLFFTFYTQKRQLHESNSTLETQRFETTFFNLVSLHNSIVNDIQLQKTVPEFAVTKGYPGRIEKKGRVCFSDFYNHLVSQFVHLSPTLFQIEEEKVKQAYNLFFYKYEYEVAHYFRNLYHIVKFVDEASITNKQRYVSLIRAQLSARELILIFYNCLSVYGVKFKPLVEKYHFLKNMNSDLLLAESHIGLYEESAYGVSSE